MSELAIKTPLGKMSIETNRLGLEIFKQHWPNVQISETNQDLPASVDGIFSVGGVIKGVFEMKSRSMSLEIFREKYNSEWLVTEDKLLKAKAVGEALKCAVFVMLYLPMDDVLMLKKIWDGEGNIVHQYSTKKCGSIESVNGGFVVRMNAFINMADAKEYRRIA